MIPFVLWVHMIASQHDTPHKPPCHEGEHQVQIATVYPREECVTLSPKISGDKREEGCYGGNWGAKTAFNGGRCAITCPLLCPVDGGCLITFDQLLPFVPRYPGEVAPTTMGPGWRVCERCGATYFKKNWEEPK